MRSGFFGRASGLFLSSPPGAGPTWISNTSSVTPGSGAAASLSVQMPASVDAGDLLLMHACNGESRTFTTPSGWTSMGSIASSGTMRSIIYYKVATGSEGGSTVTLTPSGTARMAALVSRIQSGTFDLLTPCERASPATGGGSQPNSPSFSPSWGSSSILWFSSVAGNYASPPHTVTVWPYPDGRTTVNPALGDGVSIVMMRSCNDVISASTEDPTVWAMGSSVNLWVAETIAVKPA